MKRLITTILVLVFALSATTALAARPDWAGSGQPPFAGQHGGPNAIPELNSDGDFDSF